MQKEFYIDENPECNLWDNMWMSRTIEKELEACDIENPPRDLFLEFLSKKDKILDAGCGFGKWVIFLHRLGYDIVGIDNNKLAVSKLKEFDDSLKIEAGDILNINYPDNYFNAYISMGVIEHFEEGPQAALNEAYRIVKPGGLIFVSVPAENILRRIVRRPLRNAVNSVFGSLEIIRLRWKVSRSRAFLSAVKNILPEKILSLLLLLRKRKRYCHFIEYRYSKQELENFLRQAGFKIMTTMPHDYYDNKAHSVGLWVDFPFMRVKGGWENFKLNPFGERISRIFYRISPWFACGLHISVARSQKK